MRLYEAMEKMYEGEKIRRKDWYENCYIYLNNDDIIVDERENKFYITNVGGDWEVVEEVEMIEEGREDTLEVFKELYKAVNEIQDLHIYDNIILKFIEQNDYRYVIDELKVLLDMMNNVYKLDK